MPIQKLPPQLANQIAAGEVVERPAAVVKELLENSIDAGATQITLDIEEGGVGLIALLDNGHGIPRTELLLALERHATSKIGSLEELQMVTTLGFRGEALASISAVSRLTLSSRTFDQTEGWQLYREGGEGEDPIRPVAHSVGTSVQIRDLFYNTPARRKFLRSAKTEFLHIDEIVRRLALSRLTLEITLSHNGKRVRHYRPLKDCQSPQTRLAAVCGAAFAEQALSFQQQHPLLTLQGWILPPKAARFPNDCQYCVINGRVVRDKIVSHAVRQAYQSLNFEQPSAFVLFLTMDAQQVDVNVHPTKQEVRFQQARLIHGVIYQAVEAALSPETTVLDKQPLPERETVSAKNIPSEGHRLPYSTTSASVAPAAHPKAISTSLNSRGWNPLKLPAYQGWLQVGGPTTTAPTELKTTVDYVVENSLPVANGTFGRVLTIWQQHYAVVEQCQGLVLLSLPQLQRDWHRQQLLPPAPAMAAQQTLLLPLPITLSVTQLTTLQQHQQLLHQLAWQLVIDPPNVTLRAVPSLLAAADLTTLSYRLLDYLAITSPVTPAVVVEWLVQQLTPLDKAWQPAQVIQLLTTIERQAPQWVEQPRSSWQQPIDLMSVVDRLYQVPL